MLFFPTPNRIDTQTAKGVFRQTNGGLFTQGFVFNQGVATPTGTTQVQYADGTNLTWGDGTNTEWSGT